MLVDCIVIGYLCDEVVKLEEELGYYDGFFDIVEYFYLFVIQGLKFLVIELCLDKYLFNVLIVDDIKLYKECKVVIFNGVYIVLVLVVFQVGLDIVGEVMNDVEICVFVEKVIYEEIILVLDLFCDELEFFVSVVIGCFCNLYIKYQLLFIVFNGMIKFCICILLQLLVGQKVNGIFLVCFIFVLVVLIVFYCGECNGEIYLVQDDVYWLECYQ